MPKLKIKDTIQPLTIEKLVKLLSDFHLAEFKAFLEETNAQVPLKLVRAIDRDQGVFQGGEELCKQVYGVLDERSKLNFNQLASYTFRLAGWLSRNYPSFLSHNVEMIEVLVNHGQLDKANILADNVLDIAEKIEDFRTQMAVLGFLTQEKYLHYKFGESIRLNAKLVEVLETYRTFHEIQLHFKANFNITARRTNVLETLDEHIAYFKSYTTHSSFAIQAFSRYAILFVRYYFTPSEFVRKEIQDELLSFEEDLAKYSYVTLPFLSDIQTRLTLFKLNFPDYHYGEKEGRRETERLLELGNYYRFWKYFANLPEMFVANIKATYYLSKYHHLMHNTDFLRHLDLIDKKEIEIWQDRCKVMLDTFNWGKNHLNDMIHLRLNYAALLLVGPVESRKKSLDLIEETLITFQQLSFSESLDSFIACLAIGYFSIGDYDKVTSTFTRYVKLNSNKIINHDNDWLIYTYYYASQWVLNGRKQYSIKLNELLDIVPDEKIYEPNRRLIYTLLEDFNIPKIEKKA